MNAEAAVPTPTAFWFLRHGETDWNARGLSQGNVDIPLNAVGIEQAHRAAAALRGKGIASIVASPLGRAQDTARIVAETLGLPVETEADLREVSFGVQEGQPMADWFNDWVEGHVTPEGAESFAALRARTVAAINRALTRPAPVLIVAHGALWRAFRQAAGLPANVRTPNALPLWVEPPVLGRDSWHFTPAELGG
ncbi:histidine phosphatase family protein [Roseomonas sp. OT10]|uniref:histidine phosphatase family protein n=1 Tax=Roseomonas cutis TaxID=2897332 RepID=UPI001E61CE2A|nr:histidine phosphatase family protein [Roseomonas sp. OT10]UFN50875.1 histidine phosphatase family protein [Roseomonas sp. OT10]